MEFQTVLANISFVNFLQLLVHLGQIQIILVGSGLHLEILINYQQSSRESEFILSQLDV